MSQFVSEALSNASHALHKIADELTPADKLKFWRSLICSTAFNKTMDELHEALYGPSFTSDCYQPLDMIYRYSVTRLQYVIERIVPGGRELVYTFPLSYTEPRDLVGQLERYGMRVSTHLSRSQLTDTYLRFCDIAETQDIIEAMKTCKS
jgi:hypothetical protein